MLGFSSTDPQRAFTSNWLGRLALSNALAFSLVAIALLSGIATYAVMAQLSPLTADPDTVFTLLASNLVLLGLLCIVIGWRVIVLLRARARGMAGARLHLKLVLTFSFLAVTPAVVVSGLSALFFFAGVQTWFSESVSSAVQESTAVAEAALEAHQRTIIAEILTIASAINREVGWVGDNENRLEQILNTEMQTRDLTDAIIFDGSNRIIAKTTYGFGLKFETIRDVDLERARKGDIVVMADESNARVRALIRLDRYVDTYLLVSRLTSLDILAHVQKAEQASSEYAAFAARRVELQRAILLSFAVTTLVMLLGAILLGLDVANQLVSPIKALVQAADRVRGGDLTVRVPLSARSNELGMLIRSFNRMTNQLQTQRRDLIDTNRQLDERNRFTEAVLSGVSAGVLNVDARGIIQLANARAGELFGHDEDGLIGQRLTDLLPEIAELFYEAQDRSGKLLDRQLVIKRVGVNSRTIHARIAHEVAGEELRSYVITVDEITDLVSAQRMAAWADVARRIAHEIKNPLTPIQLSAERLKRKYLRQIEQEPQVFQECIDTIVRQVDDIRRMVDEFSAFARMPQAVIRPFNISTLIREAVVLEKEAHPEMIFDLRLPEQDFLIPCDHRQVRQALTNVIQNAINSILERPQAREVLPNGNIQVSLQQEGDSVLLSVMDNGKGLPTEDRDRLTEPYVTTRVKGTGLGLAIVKKIMEDHSGTIQLRDNPEGGAIVRLAFPALNEQENLSAHEEESIRAEKGEDIPHGT